VLPKEVRRLIGSCKASAETPVWSNVSAAEAATIIRTTAKSAPEICLSRCWQIHRAHLIEDYALTLFADLVGRLIEKGIDSLMVALNRCALTVKLQKTR
jgi:hypothetical protein